jgi:hypothetical protein
MNTPAINTRKRLERLQERRNGKPLVTNFSGATLAKEAFERIQEDDGVKYVVGSMQPINPEYTKNTFVEADRVKSQLESNFPGKGVRASFDYQGSVTNDTHIVRYSDIDLLAVTDNFVFKENPARVSSPYTGNPTVELLVQHNASVQIITDRFPEVTVDTSGGKAIQLSGGSLRRKIDVITTTWWDTVAYDVSLQKKDRGIKIFNYKALEPIANKPFLHNHNIHTKDTLVGGNLRKAIRFLKTVKADTNEDAGYAKIDLSSYDICAIAYAMDNQRLWAGPDEELKLAANVQRLLDFLEQNEGYRNSLDVPNGTRRIFCAEGASFEGLKQLNREVKA